MISNDVINGTFEIVGAVAIFFNVRQLWKDKEVKGVYWPSVFFFFSWGVWNLFYYPSLDQWFSLFGGILLAIGNVVWLLLLLKFSMENNNVTCK